MRRASIAAATVAAALWSVVAASEPAPGVTHGFAALGVEPYDPPKPAPAFALPDLAGRQVRLEGLRGKVVLLFFWATW